MKPTININELVFENVTLIRKNYFTVLYDSDFQYVDSFDTLIEKYENAQSILRYKSYKCYESLFCTCDGFMNVLKMFTNINNREYELDIFVLSGFTMDRENELEIKNRYNLKDGIFRFPTQMYLDFHNGDIDVLHYWFKNGIERKMLELYFDPKKLRKNF